jgi:hypothetical protein
MYGRAKKKSQVFNFPTRYVSPVMAGIKQNLAPSFAVPSRLGGNLEGNPRSALYINWNLLYRVVENTSTVAVDPTFFSAAPAVSQYTFQLDPNSMGITSINRLCFTFNVSFDIDTFALPISLWFFKILITTMNGSGLMVQDLRNYAMFWDSFTGESMSEMEQDAVYNGVDPETFQPHLVRYKAGVTYPFKFDMPGSFFDELRQYNPRILQMSTDKLAFTFFPSGSCAYTPSGATAAVPTLVSINVESIEQSASLAQVTQSSAALSVPKCLTVRQYQEFRYNATITVGTSVSIPLNSFVGQYYAFFVVAKVGAFTNNTYLTADEILRAPCFGRDLYVDLVLANNASTFSPTGGLGLKYDTALISYFDPILPNGYFLRQRGVTGMFFGSPISHSSKCFNGYATLTGQSDNLKLNFTTVAVAATTSIAKSAAANAGQFCLAVTDTEDNCSTVVGPLNYNASVGTIQTALNSCNVCLRNNVTTTVTNDMTSGTTTTIAFNCPQKTDRNIVCTIISNNLNNTGTQVTHTVTQSAGVLGCPAAGSYNMSFFVAGVKLADILLDGKGGISSSNVY